MDKGELVPPPFKPPNCSTLEDVLRQPAPHNTCAHLSNMSTEQCTRTRVGRSFCERDGLGRCRKNPYYSCVTV